MRRMDRGGRSMHDDVVGSFWSRVAEYIDERDLRWLRQWWNDDSLFLDVSIHVASCGRCLSLRSGALQSWEPLGDEVW